MKYFTKEFIAAINKIWLFLFSSLGCGVLKSRFFLVSVKGCAGNSLSFINSNFEKVKMHVKGQGNVFIAKSALISDTEITIQGKNNQLIIEHGVKLRGAVVIIRGNNCSLFIGQNSSFGGIRIVNVGQNCTISIGKDCMFADQIELWASDTHPIYGEHGEVLNPEQSIIIGDKVWVGVRAILLKGITIGSGSIIGMGTVVTSDIPESAISVGHPNKLIKRNISWSVYYSDQIKEVT